MPVRFKFSDIDMNVIFFLPKMGGERSVGAWELMAIVSEV